jgi:adenylate cyclase
VSSPVRVPRTFIFCDLTGFTSFTAANGDDAAGRLLGAFRAEVRRVSSERGVRVAKWLGDGAMFVALDAADGVSASLDLEAAVNECCAPLSLRIGIASGRALLFEGDDYIGSSVNLAARLCDAAQAGEVLIPSEQALDLPPGVGAEPARVIELRGFDEPVAAMRLTGRPEAPARNDTGELWTRSPYVA